MKKNEDHTENLKESFLLLDDIVPTLDKIGSGFEGIEETALALLLYFREKKVLTKLAKIRWFVSAELQKQLPVEVYDDFIEQELDPWRPPYGKTKDELLKLINETEK